MKGIKIHPNKTVGAHALVRMGIPLVFIGCYVLLAALPDLRLAVPELLGITAVLTILLLLILYLGRKGKIFFSPPAILLMAAFFRLLFLFHSPQLSDDIYRYLFDGRQLLSGHNPYALSPESASRQYEGMADLAAKVNHSHLVTIYPPGAQLVFAAGAFLGGITGMKLLLIGLDLLLISLIMRLLSFLKLPACRAILYAWHPLAVLEISASGHIDGAGLFFAFLALCLLMPRTAGGEATGTIITKEPVRPASPKKSPAHLFTSGILISVAILVKLFPVVFLPGLWRLIPGCGRKWFFAGSLTASLFLLASFLPDIKNSLVTLKLYSGTWEFAGFLFRFLRELFHSGNTARGILGLTFAVLIVGCYRQPLRSKRAPSTPQASLAAMLKSGYAISFCFLLLTPTLHPWYALYLLSFLPFCPGIVGITLSWSILLGYRVLISYGILNQWTEDNLTPLMIWGGPIAAFLTFRFCLWRRPQPEKGIKPFHRV